jgi:hypothetical protein
MQLLPQNREVRLPNGPKFSGSTSASSDQAAIAARLGRIRRRTGIPGFCFNSAYSFFFSLSGHPDTSSQSLALIQ